MTPRIYAITAALAMTASAACAQSDSDGGFSVLDTDRSGGISLSELQAAGATVTEETFALYDADGSGELSLEEYASWAGGEKSGQ